MLKCPDGYIEKEIMVILLFFDLRDHFGLTQCVIENSNKFFKIVEKIKPESVVCVSGEVVERSSDTVNKELFTGEVEVKISII